MIEVLGIDVGSVNWASNGSAQLAFELGASRFAGLSVPALRWPNKRLTAVALADTIDDHARHFGVVAVAIDGPQGWRDPETPKGLPGVGRRCEFECRAQAKTGIYPQTFPSNQGRWVEFCVELFASLLGRPGVRIASNDASNALAQPRGSGYVVLESFPTSLWRTAGLSPLPAKSNDPDLRLFADSLFKAFSIPSPPIQIASHDDLQAVVAAIAAAAYVGGPAVSLARGVPAVPRDIDGRAVFTEGLIWDAKPLDSTESASVTASTPVADEGLATPSGSYVRVTQNVIDQVARAGRAQAQIALQGFPGGTKDDRISVVVEIGDELYPLTIGDSHAAWVSHQIGEAAAGFDRLFACLSDQPDVWVAAASRPGLEPAHALPDDPLASHGPDLSDPLRRTVSIPIRLVEGRIEGFDRELPALKDCVGDLVVPAFAVSNPAELEWLTQTNARMLLDKGTPVLFRVSGRQVPPALKARCRTEPIPYSGVPGAFVEARLEEPLYLRSRGTKKAILEPASCVVPALDGLKAKSLNEAYRRISEKFEPKRRSVGGNVFRGCYYFDVALAEWRPIGELRGDIIFVPR